MRFPFGEIKDSTESMERNVVFKGGGG